MTPKSIRMSERKQIITTRLGAEHLEFLNRAGPRKRSWRLRRDLELLKRLLHIAEKQPHIPVGEAFELAGEKILTEE